MKAPNTFKEADANKTSRWAQTAMGTEELLSLPIDELFVRLETSQLGLTSQEAETRLETYGYNELVKRETDQISVGN